MKHAAKRILSLALLLGLCMTMVPTAHAAYTPKHKAEADTLYTLGLFKGTGVHPDGTPIYELEAEATRIQGLVMLIRLLGEEAEALAFTGPCPFTDVAPWAQKYAAYAFAKGYTKGTTATTFGADDPLLGKAYVTFVLRALGYNDAAGDFSYNDALTPAAQLGLIEEGSCTGIIYRDDCAAISYNALKTNLKNDSGTLADKLVTTGAITKEGAALLNSGTVSVPVTVTFNEKVGRHSITFKTADLFAAFPTAEYLDGSGWGGVTPAAFAQRDFSLSRLLLSSRAVTASMGGKKNNPDSLRRQNSTGYSYSGGNNMLILTVLDKDLKMLGYCILAPQTNVADATTLTFTTCDYGGKEEIQRLQKVINSIKKLDKSLLHCEKIITKMPDGTEQSAIYLRINEAKLPKDVQDFKYYVLASGGNKDAFLRYYSVGNPAMPQQFGVDTVGSNRFGRDDPQYEKMYLYLLDESKDILAAIELPTEMKLIETVVQQ